MTSMRMVHLTVLVALLVSAGSASAVPEGIMVDMEMEDALWIHVDAAGDIIAGVGTGYNEGQWYYYQGSDCWRQWFYNGAYDTAKWCEIQWFVSYMPLDHEADSWARFTYSWTTPEYSQGQPQPDEPPLPPLTPADEDAFIVSHEPPIREGQLDHGGMTYLDDPVPLEEHSYNPQWFSVDIRGYNIKIQEMVLHHQAFFIGDVNRDLFVGQSDLDIVLAMWGRSGAEITDPRADANHDDFVGQGDLDYVLAAWGQGTPPPTPVPEPATLPLLGLAGLAVVRKRH